MTTSLVVFTLTMMILSLIWAGRSLTTLDVNAFTMLIYLALLPLRYYFDVVVVLYVFI